MRDDEHLMDYKNFRFSEEPLVLGEDLSEHGLDIAFLTFMIGWVSFGWQRGSVFNGNLQR